MKLYHYVTKGNDVLGNGIDDIYYSPIDWSVCDDELHRRFAYARYYLIVVKGGVIEPKYLKIVKL